MNAEIRKQKAEKGELRFSLLSSFCFLTFSVPLCLCGFFGAVPLSSPVQFDNVTQAA